LLVASCQQQTATVHQCNGLQCTCLGLYNISTSVTTYMILLHHLHDPHPSLSQVWDLTAGKLLHGFQHEDSITGLEFHPSEVVLATSSADRTVKWWDLESSELIDTAGPEVTGQHQAEATPGLHHA